MSNSKEKNKDKESIILRARKGLSGFLRAFLQVLIDWKNEIPVIISKLKTPVNTQYRLGMLHISKGNLNDARFRFFLATLFDKSHYKAHYRLGWCNLQRGQIIKAKKSFQTALMLKKDLPEPKFWIDVIEGKSPHTVPTSITMEDADRWADIYEDFFTKNLKYKGHEHISEAIKEFLEEDKSILDLGCGTGLVADEIKKINEKTNITGVDISSKMLEKANAKNIYGKLIEGNFLEFLASEKEKYDIITASYVTDFLGDMKRFFELSNQALKKDGILAFTAFSGEKDYEITIETATYTHSEKYIKSYASATGFESLRNEKKEILENADGNVYVFKK